MGLCRKQLILLHWFLLMLIVCHGSRIKHDITTFKPRSDPQNSGHFLGFLPRMPIPFSGPSRKHNDIGLKSWGRSPWSSSSSSQIVIQQERWNGFLVFFGFFLVNLVRNYERGFGTGRYLLYMELLGLIFIFLGLDDTRVCLLVCVLFLLHTQGLLV